MTAALEITNVGKRFGPVVALTDVNLTVRQGERHALIGPNGSGKSTLFNLISGNFAPSNGAIAINGKPLKRADPTTASRSGIGRSFQITRIFAEMSVRENIELAVMSSLGRRWSFSRRGSSWDEVEARTGVILAASPLAKLGDDPAGTLSYSNQRALEICLTIGTNPQVVLLDEPTAGMSRDETREVIAFIRSITKDRTLLVVEHDMEVVFSLADRVSVLAEGRIIATDTPDRIKSDPEVKKAYLGDNQVDP